MTLRAAQSPGGTDGTGPQWGAAGGTVAERLDSAMQELKRAGKPAWGAAARRARARAGPRGRKRSCSWGLLPSRIAPRDWREGSGWARLSPGVAATRCSARRGISRCPGAGRREE